MEKCFKCEKGKMRVTDVSDLTWTVKKPGGEHVSLRLPETFEALRCDKCDSVSLYGNQEKEVGWILNKFV
jgi:hypothetical protein